MRILERDMKGKSLRFLAILKMKLNFNFKIKSYRKWPLERQRISIQARCNWGERSGIAVEGQQDTFKMPSSILTFN